MSTPSSYVGSPKEKVEKVKLFAKEENKNRSRSNSLSSIDENSSASSATSIDKELARKKRIAARKSANAVDPNKS